MQSSSLCNLPVELIELIVAELAIQEFEGTLKFRSVCRELDAKSFHWFASRHLRELWVDPRHRYLSRLHVLCRKSKRALPYVRHLSFCARPARYTRPPNGWEYFPCITCMSPWKASLIWRLRDNLANDLIYCRSFSIRTLPKRFYFDYIQIAEAIAACFSVIADSRIPVRSFQLFEYLPPIFSLDHPYVQFRQLAMKQTENGLLSAWSHLENLTINCALECAIEVPLDSPKLAFLQVIGLIKNAPNLRVLNIDFRRYGIYEATTFVKEIVALTSCPSISELKFTDYDSANGYELNHLLRRLRHSLRVLRLEDISFNSTKACETFLECISSDLPALEEICLARMSRSGSGIFNRWMFAFPALAAEPFTTSRLRQQCRLKCFYTQAEFETMQLTSRAACPLPVVGVTYRGPDISEVLSCLRPLKQYYSSPHSLMREKCSDWF